MAKMITEKKKKELRRRMLSHTSVNDIAVCVVTARELQELLDRIDELEEEVRRGGRIDD